MLKKLKLKSLKDDSDGFVGIILMIVAMLVFIWLISTIAGMIIPLAIFLILAIVFIMLIKKVLFGGESLGIIKGLSGIGREAGKETIGLMGSAKSEYGEYKSRKKVKGNGSGGNLKWQWGNK